MAKEPIRIVEAKCVGCGLCIEACPFAALALEGDLARVDLAKCNLCGACVDTCEYDAIELEKETETVCDLSAYRDVWVFAEQNEGEIEPVTYFENSIQIRALPENVGGNDRPGQFPFFPAQGDLLLQKVRVHVPRDPVRIDEKELPPLKHDRAHAPHKR